MKLKIRKNDKVVVICGREEDRGKQGEVIKVLTDSQRVVVQGINIRTKHQRQMQTQGRTISPGRVRFEAPIHISNVMLVCPKCGKPTRIELRRGEGGTSRFCKKCNSPIDE
jgi:large subunit ribosomal protein L24